MCKNRGKLKSPNSIAFGLSAGLEEKKFLGQVGLPLQLKPQLFEVGDFLTSFVISPHMLSVCYYKQH